MTAPARFRQEDIKRAVAGAEAAGMHVGRVEIEPCGKIVIMADRIAPPTDANPWDLAVGKA